MVGFTSHSPQRLAWTVLLSAFLGCCALAVGIPAAATSFINHSTYVASIDVKLQAGRTIAFSPPETEYDARVVDQTGRALEEGGTVIVDNNPPSQAYMTIRSSDGLTTTLVTMQLYSGTRLKVERARIPRFDIATSPMQITLDLLAGRVQIQDQQPDNSRPLDLQVKSEHMSAALSFGEYSFEVTPGETSLFVRDGVAMVTSAAKPETFRIEANQRTVVQKGQGVMPGVQPRNLIRDGHFEAPIAHDWITDTQVYVPGDVIGAVSVVRSTAGSSLLLARPGVGLNWGRTGVKQIIDEDVSGRSSVQLRVNFTILYQELQVCGGQGSECPFMVTINYQTKGGGTAEWTQGFYADGTPHMPDLPDFIVQSGQPQLKHIAVRLGRAETWESQNLLEELPNMQIVNYIELYAEGHGVETQINSVQLQVLD